MGVSSMINTRAFICAKSGPNRRTTETDDYIRDRCNQRKCSYQSVPYRWSVPPPAYPAKPGSAKPPPAWPSSYSRSAQRVHRRCPSHTDRDIAPEACKRKGDNIHFGYFLLLFLNLLFGAFIFWFSINIFRSDQSD